MHVYTQALYSVRPVLVTIRKWLERPCMQNSLFVSKCMTLISVLSYRIELRRVTIR